MDASPPTRLPAPAPAPAATADACPPTPVVSPPAPSADAASPGTRAAIPDSSSTTHSAIQDSPPAGATTHASPAMRSSPPAPATFERASTSPTAPPSSPLAPPTSPLAPPTSPLEPPASPLEPPASPLAPPASPLPPPASPLPPPASPLPPAASAPVPVSWAFRFAQVGGGIEDCGTYIGAWETMLQELSQFLLQLAGYVPEGQFPGFVLLMTRACRGISQALSYLASMAKGLSGLCLLIGGGMKHLSQVYGQGTVDGDVENPDAAPRFIVICSYVQLQELLATSRGSSVRLQVDVDDAMSPRTANDCFELLRALNMVLNAVNLTRKLAQYHEETSSSPQPPRSPGT